MKIGTWAKKLFGAAPAAPPSSPPPAPSAPPPTEGDSFDRQKQNSTTTTTPATQTQKPAGGGLFARLAHVVSDAATSALHAITSAVSPDSMRAAKMTVVDNGPAKGVSEKCIVADEQGARFMFKVSPRNEHAFEREHFAMALRQRAGTPSVAVAPSTITRDGASVTGFVKPMLDNAGPLTAEVTTWSPAEKAAVVADHAWAEFLGNYDTKPDQYVKAGGGALNIDWDHALEDHATRPTAHDDALSRHKHRKGISPPTQQMLLSAYARGDVDVDFSPLFSAISQIEKLTRADIEAALGPFIASAFGKPGVGWGPFKTPSDLVDNVMARQSTLRARFDDLVTRTRAERAEVEAWVSSGGSRWAMDVSRGASQGDMRLELMLLLMKTPLVDIGYRVAQACRSAFRKLGF